MHSGRTLIGISLAAVSVLLAIVSGSAAAQPPFVINGLHSELSLDEAVAQAEKLGGVCQVTASRPNEEGRNVQCEYRHCNETAAAVPADKCDAKDATATGPTFAQQPIVSIILQAPADTARITRMFIVYNGATDAIAAGLIKAFGPTEAEGAPSDTQSWSHARRWSWRAGQYRMGLLDAPPWITLATDRPPASPVGDGTEAAP